MRCLEFAFRWLLEHLKKPRQFSGSNRVTRENGDKRETRNGVLKFRRRRCVFRWQRKGLVARWRSPGPGLACCGRSSESERCGRHRGRVKRARSQMDVRGSVLSWRARRDVSLSVLECRRRARGRGHCRNRRVCSVSGRVVGLSQ